MPKRVLLYVEDDDAAYFILELTLEETGADIDLRRATDGDEALAYVRRLEGYADAPRPDLILLDLNLPKRSGIEVLAELKRDVSLRSIPVVVFSSSALATDKAVSLELGADDYVVKPANLNGLLEAVKRMVSLPKE